MKELSNFVCACTHVCVLCGMCVYSNRNEWAKKGTSQGCMSHVFAFLHGTWVYTCMCAGSPFVRSESELPKRRNSAEMYIHMCVRSDTCASRKENGIRVCADSEEKLWFTPVRWKQVLGEKTF